MVWRGASDGEEDKCCGCPVLGAPWHVHDGNTAPVGLRHNQDVKHSTGAD